MKDISLKDKHVMPAVIQNTSEIKRQHNRCWKMVIVMIWSKYYRIVSAGQNIQKRMHSKTSKTNSITNSTKCCASKTSLKFKYLMQNGYGKDTFKFTDWYYA